MDMEHEVRVGVDGWIEDGLLLESSSPVLPPLVSPVVWTMKVVAGLQKVLHCTPLLVLRRCSVGPLLVLWHCFVGPLLPSGFSDDGWYTRRKSTFCFVLICSFVYFSLTRPKTFKRLRERKKKKNRKKKRKKKIFYYQTIQNMLKCFG